MTNTVHTYSIANGIYIKIEFKINAPIKIGERLSINH